MNPIDNNINKVASIEKKIKTERIALKKNLKANLKNKNQIATDESLEKVKRSINENYIYKQFINHNEEISRTIYLKDTLQALFNELQNTQNSKQAREIVENYINSSTFKGVKVLKNYEGLLKTGDKTAIGDTISKLLSSIDYKLKRLNTIIQNLDSILNHRFDNTTNTLNEIIISLSKNQNSNIENLISNIQSERVIKLLKG